MAMSRKRRDKILAALREPGAFLSHRVTGNSYRLAAMTVRSVEVDELRRDGLLQVIFNRSDGSRIVGPFKPYRLKEPK